MKKIMMLAITALMMIGCTTQPIPTASGGKSKTSTLSGNEISVFTLPVRLSFGGTNIIAKDGATITFVPNPPISNNPF